MTTPRAQYFGMYPAVVCDNQDPERQGRVKVRLPWSPDSGGDEYAVWARLATTMAGGGRGTWFVPETGDEVLVGFGGGDPNWPYVIGALWNGQDEPPESMDDGNNLRSIVSRTGIRITLDDTDGAVTLSLRTPGGQQLTLEDGGSTIRLADSGGNSLEMAPAGITLTAASTLSIKAQAIQIDAGSAKSSPAMWAHDGALQCDTLIANNVVGKIYTGGPGNLQ
ncbi:phage baseplate assembly protein V [Streptomyces sp. NPDC002677]|uniref:phage baseplate assembly protein V n=1 Tax=Streptomyces sp. NPDC002677 TaxID=3154774 RepID=UPI0033223455